MPFAIAQVSPHPWEARTELGVYVERVAAELAARGHRVLVVAPSQSARSAAASRRALRDARDDPASLLGGDGSPGLFFAGEVLAAGGRGPGLGVDVARAVEELLGALALDFVHVHEPFAPSAASAALRHSRALNVASFHEPTERLLSTQVARRFVELFFGRLDARIASYHATAAVMASHFPADYRVIAPMVTELPPRGAAPPGAAPLRIAFVAAEERVALRTFLRALRRLPPGCDWQAAVIGAPAAGGQVGALRADLRDRVTFVADPGGDRAAALADADVVVLASAGALPAPGVALQAIGARAVPLASRLAVYEEVLADGDRGLLFEPGDVDTLAAQLARLAHDRPLRARLVDAAEDFRWSLSAQRAVDQLEEVYEAVAARRHQSAPAPRGRTARALIDVDLHMHTDHSPDCATPVEVLLATARQEGFGAIAITDHNEISGALEAAAKAEGIKVIVGEEVKTAAQGEVIGLFLRERIPRGRSLEETVAEIRRQGGLVYVPHPFDRMHTVPGYEHLLAILEEVDAIEIYNPRVAIGSFNEEAARFAAKYRVTAAAGSDAHVAAGLGSVRLRMRDFDGPAEFLDSLRDAEIITRPTSLLYVQALKFLETRATPEAARRARRARRVRRAMRKS